MQGLYLGRFNYKGEISTFYRYASSKAQAKQIMIKAMADKLGVKPASLRIYFFGLQDNFILIKMEKEVTT